MKELFVNDECDLILHADADDVTTNSLFVAKFFNKRHDHVLRDIDRLLDVGSGLSEEFKSVNFKRAEHINAKNKKQPYYDMTIEGLIFLALGYRGAKAVRFKELYMKKCCTRQDG